MKDHLQRIEPNRLYRDEAVAVLLDTPLDTVKNWRKIGQGPTYLKTGNRSVRYSGQHLLDWISGLTVIDPGQAA